MGDAAEFVSVPTADDNPGLPFHDMVPRNRLLVRFANEALFAEPPRLSRPDTFVKVARRTDPSPPHHGTRQARPGGKFLPMTSPGTWRDRRNVAQLAIPAMPT